MQLPISVRRDDPPEVIDPTSMPADLAPRQPPTRRTGRNNSCRSRAVGPRACPTPGRTRSRSNGGEHTAQRNLSPGLPLRCTQPTAIEQGDEQPHRDPGRRDRRPIGPPIHERDEQVVNERAADARQRADRQPSSDPARINPRTAPTAVRSTAPWMIPVAMLWRTLSVYQV